MSLSGVTTRASAARKTVTTTERGAGVQSPTVLTSKDCTNNGKGSRVAVSDSSDVDDSDMRYPGSSDDDSDSSDSDDSDKDSDSSDFGDSSDAESNGSFEDEDVENITRVWDRGAKSTSTLGEFSRAFKTMKAWSAYPPPYFISMLSNTLQVW